MFKNNINLIFYAINETKLKCILFCTVFSINEFVQFNYSRLYFKPQAQQQMFKQVETIKQQPKAFNGNSEENQSMDVQSKVNSFISENFIDEF